MKNPFQLRAATRLLADWWSELGPDGQAQYLKDHPNSEKAKEARRQQEKTQNEAPKPEGKPGVDEKPKQKPVAPGKPLADFVKQFDDPNVTVDQIFSKLKPEDVKEIKEKTKEAMSLPPSDQLYGTGKGPNDYTPERRALHDKIIKSVLTAEAIKAATPKPGEKPTFVVLGGRGGCLSSDHEFLTRSGWKRIDQYQPNDEVLVVDIKGKKSWFEQPQDYIKVPWTDFYHLKARGVDLLVTPEHRIPYVKKFNRHVLRVSTAQEVVEDHDRLATGWDGLLPCTFSAPHNAEGVSLTDDELRLMVAVCADGNFALETTRRCRVSVSKDRKKNRLQHLLLVLGLDYKISVRKDRKDGLQEWRFSFDAPQNNKLLATYWQASAHQLAIIADELLHWDGWEDKYGSWIFTSTQKCDADFVSYVFSTLGRRSSWYCDDRDGTGWSPVWRVSGAKNGGYAGLRSSSVESAITASNGIDGFKYCFTVSTGFFVTRRNDCICVTGNSGKSGFTNGTISEFEPSKFLTLDADAVKEALEPPYEGWNANQVHEESSYVFDKIMDAAQKMGLNIISDATLKSDKMGPVMEDLLKKGYDIEGHYMFLPRQKAAQRACGRYLKDGPQNRGRLVPPEVILGNTKNEENFDKLKKYFKRFSAYNNDVAKGQPPQLIDHSDYYKDRKMPSTYNDDSWEKDSMAPHERKQAASTRQKAAMSPRYTADDWENDPFLSPNPQRAKKVAAESFSVMRALGVPANEVLDPATRQKYQEFLAKK